MHFLSLLTGSTASGAIDVTVVDALLDLMTSLLGMFAIFPLNIYLTSSIIAIGIGVFVKLKRGAK